MYKAAVLTVSDRCSEGRYEDRTGPVVKEMLENISLKVILCDIVSDDKEALQDKMIEVCNADIDILVTNGGTGFSLRDNTPEATLAVIDRHVPGIPEAMRMKCFEKTPKSMLSRAAAGMRGKTLIVNLPGSPKGAKESFEVIAPIVVHALDMISGKDH